MSTPRHPHRPRRPGAAGHTPRASGHPASRRSAASHRPRASADPSQQEATEPTAETQTPADELSGSSTQEVPAPADDLTDSGAPAPADELADSGAPPPANEFPSSGAPARLAARLRVPVPALLGVLAVLLGTFAIVAATQANSLLSSAGQNTALTDSVTTSQITSQVSAEIATIFSYSYTDIARTQQAARRELTGPAIREYASAIKTVAAAAAPNKLVVTTTVTYAGVEYLHGDRAHVLLFVNLSDTSDVTGQTTSQPGMLAVDVVWQGTTWKITNIHTFTSPG